MKLSVSAVLMLACVAAGPLAAQVVERDTTRAVTLDPLVVSPSKQVEKAVDAPAHTEVVGEAAIDDRPAIALTEHLRNVPGIDIATTGVQSSNIVARGFNNIFSGALHAITDNRLAGVPSLRVNLLHFSPTTNEDVSRMEVVLGPGAALYGPNTADGILHIITKSPIDSPEMSLAVTGGNQDLAHVSGRVARRFSDQFGIKLSAQYFRAEEWAYTDPAEIIEQQRFASNPSAFRRDLMLKEGIDSAAAEVRIQRIGNRSDDAERFSGELRADWRPLSNFNAVLAAGLSNELNGVELTGLGAAQAENWRTTYYQARATWGRLFGQLYLNQNDAGDTYLLRTGAPITDRSRLLVGPLQHATPLGPINFTYGADFQLTTPVTEGTINGSYEDDDDTQEYGAYLQTETQIDPSIELVLAGRVDSHSALPDEIFSPRAALLLKPSESQTFRVTYNRAFSTPSSLTQFLDLASSFPRADLAGLGYSLRIQGTGDEGFQFLQPGGGYLAVSPFTPASLGGAGTPLPASTTVLWPIAVGVAAQGAAQRGAPLSPALVSFLSAQQPTDAQIGLNYLNPANTADVGPLSSLVLPEIDPITESTSTTIELGYKGILGSRLLLAADVWHTTKQNLVTPLTLQSRLLLLNGPQIVAFLTPRLVSGLGMSPAVAQATATSLAQAMAPIPLGAITAPNVTTNSAQLLVTYTNVDEEIDFWGTDLSASFLITDLIAASATASFVNQATFPTAQAGLITLNAPTKKGSFALIYGNGGSSFTGEARVRYNDTFAVKSGVYEAVNCLGPPHTQSVLAEDCVDSFTLFDLTAGYRLTRFRDTSIQLAVQNVLDEDYRAFPGAPAIGRMVMLRLKYGN